MNTDGTLNRDPTPVSSGSITGAMAHTGTTVGFYGVTPVARPSAFTQTYSAATRTHSNPVAASVSASAVLVTPFGFSSSAQADNLVIAVNNLVTDLLNVKQVLNQLVDDLQAQGLIQ